MSDTPDRLAGRIPEGHPPKDQGLEGHRLAGHGLQGQRLEGQAGEGRAGAGQAGVGQAGEGQPPGGRPRLPAAGERWRCGGCGNLTRFDVVHTSQAREFWHVSLSGHGTVEESTVLVESVESVTCRWCGRADAIEYVPRVGPGGP